MERAAFLLMQSNERISCMLNPQSVILRRRAGIRQRTSLGAAFISAEISDLPLLYTGGGTTELCMDLLFDISVSGSTIRTDDVRDLTSPFWEMAENMIDSQGRHYPPQVRFIWGKSWNIPAVVIRVAEKFDRFNRGGSPSRSWMRLRLLRIIGETEQPASAQTKQKNVLIPERKQKFSNTEVVIHRVSPHDRLESIAAKYYGNSSYWRLLATHNDISDPLHLSPGSTIRIIPVSEMEAKQ